MKRLAIRAYRPNSEPGEAILGIEIACGYQSHPRTPALSLRQLCAVLRCVERNPVRAGWWQGCASWNGQVRKPMFRARTRDGSPTWISGASRAASSAGDRWWMNPRLSSRPESCGGPPTRANPSANKRLLRRFATSESRCWPVPTVSAASRMDRGWPMRQPDPKPDDDFTRPWINAKRIGQYGFR